MKLIWLVCFFIFLSRILGAWARSCDDENIKKQEKYLDYSLEQQCRVLHLLTKISTSLIGLSFLLWIVFQC